MKGFTTDIIVCDDKSNDEKLGEVCKKHNVPLLVSDKHYIQYGTGDVNLFKMSLEYANEHGYEYVLKISRRWVMMETPFDSLNWLINVSDGSTYTNLTIPFGFGFRTECICLRVKEWISVINDMKNAIDKNNHGLVEAFIHNLARKVESKSNIYKIYKNVHRFPDDCSGYVRWDWIGDKKNNTPNYILWHDKNKSEDYFEKSKQLNLNWTLKDFKI